MHGHLKHGHLLFKLDSSPSILTGYNQMYESNLLTYDWKKNILFPFKVFPPYMLDIAFQ